eukprot:GHVN01055922.1.p1 GENE.GHVN01055922.1~~GHVN01055922.1.p1  ORF type:complete len:220 (+),score=39.18 GHVN01055922.1:50-709(+)
MGIDTWGRCGACRLTTYVFTAAVLFMAGGLVVMVCALAVIETSVWLSLPLTIHFAVGGALHIFAGVIMVIEVVKRWPFYVGLTVTAICLMDSTALVVHFSVSYDPRTAAGRVIATFTLIWMIVIVVIEYVLGVFLLFVLPSLSAVWAAGGTGREKMSASQLIAERRNYTQPPPTFDTDGGAPQPILHGKLNSNLPPFYEDVDPMGLGIETMDPGIDGAR